jgi:4'-phosphopantetheinyl transferase EntD
MLATRALLTGIISNEHIHYKNRAPFLVKSDKEISISNSRNTVVILLNDKEKNAGVDIQYFSDTVLRVKNKFLHHNEHSLYTDYNEMEILNIIWSAKESLYKAYSEEKLNFKRQIIVQCIKPNLIKGIIIRDDFSESFELGVFKSDKYVVTWFK